MLDSIIVESDEQVTFSDNPLVYYYSYLKNNKTLTHYIIAWQK
jgi:hypothetical protein